jgi:hypothetical protein
LNAAVSDWAAVSNRSMYPLSNLVVSGGCLFAEQFGDAFLELLCACGVALRCSLTVRTSVGSTGSRSWVRASIRDLRCRLSFRRLTSSSLMGQGTAHRAQRPGSSTAHWPGPGRTLGSGSGTPDSSAVGRRRWPSHQSGPKLSSVWCAAVVSRRRRPRRGRCPPPTQGDRAAPAAMTHRGPVRVVDALRPAGRGDLGLKHRDHHRHPGSHAHRQQPLPRRAGDIGQRQPNLLRQIRQHHGGIGRVSNANSCST